METPAFFFTKALSHRQKVLRLFKRAMRECNNWYWPDVMEASYNRCLVRQRFDMHKNEPDSRKARKMLLDGVKELWHKRHFQPLCYANDPTGIAHGREPAPEDQVLDLTWTHQEKKAYPYYFERREQRKRELLDYWDKIEGSWKNVNAK